MGCSDGRHVRRGAAFLASAAVFTAAALGGCPARGDELGASSETMVQQDPQASARAAALRDALADEARSARRWRWAWTGINFGLAAFSFGSMPFVSRSRWPELVTSGVGSALSTGLTVAWPLDVEAAAATGHGADLDGLRARAIAAGRDERDRVRWGWHVVNLGVGVAYFAILGVGYGHRDSGAWAGVSAFAIGEAQTLTQPTGATRFAPGSFTW